MSKILHYILLIKNNYSFSVSDSYGFKAKTTQCTFAFMETINYYRQNNTNVYVLLLDASQAFDKINYVKLFELLRRYGRLDVVTSVFYVHVIPFSTGECHKY